MGRREVVERLLAGRRERKEVRVDEVRRERRVPRVAVRRRRVRKGTM